MSKPILEVLVRIDSEVTQRVVFSNDNLSFGTIHDTGMLWVDEGSSPVARFAPGQWVYATLVEKHTESC